MLIYTTDRSPGIIRKGAGKGFYYLDSSGNKIEDKLVLERIRSLAIPPAYTDVWICSLENGHLQATGRDQRKRKQYRYHPEWQRIRNLDKFDKLIEIGAGLPRLRRRIRADLKVFSGTRTQVIAAAVRLIDKLGFRVGNDRYLEENKTRGISTLAPKNIEIDESALIRLQYIGKGGRTVEASFSDAALANVLDQCHELGGQRLFSYRDATKELCPIDSSDINNYLQETYESNVTAKDLRTWRASVEATKSLMSVKRSENKEAEIREAITYAAKKINNRYATCRKHYVHPKILESYENSGRSGFSRLKIEPVSELQQAESMLMRLLET